MKSSAPFHPIWYVIIFILPFVMFFWMVPFVSEQTLGNDYPRFSIQHQMELMFSLKNGSFPLYIPGFAGGQSASALTQGQIFHPLAHLCAFMPGYWHGKALEWNTFWRLITLALVHLALFGFLLKLQLEDLVAFILSAVTVYNLRMLDMFRYGASLEAWTGCLFLCAAMGWYCLKSEGWRMPLLIIAATYWLVCSGQPQMMYFGLIVAGLSALVMPYFLAEMLSGYPADIRTVFRFWLKTMLWCSLGILLSFAYILPFWSEFVTTNAGRVGQDYAWANIYQDTFMGILNNFFYPLRSDVTGAFGGSSLILLAVLTPVLYFFRIRIPKVIWGILGLVFVIFLYIQGARTLIHYIVWKYLPFAGSFRGPGRISLMLPILLMLILAWITKSRTFSFRCAGQEIQMTPAAILAITALIVTGIYICLPDTLLSDTAPFSATSFRKIPTGFESAMVMTGALALGILAVHSFFPGAARFSGMLFCILLCAQLTGMIYYGTWTTHRQDTPTFARMCEEKQTKLTYHVDLPGYGLCTAAVVRQAKQSYLEPFLGKVYPQYLTAKDNVEAYKLMTQGRTPWQVVLENYEPEAELEKARMPENTDMTDPAISDQVRLAYSSFNRLVFEVSASVPGFFGMAYPYTGHWRARVNGKMVRIWRANGDIHGTRIPIGHSRVEFWYESPGAFWGMMVSWATLALIGAMFSFRFRTPMNLLSAIVVMLLCSGGFMLWHHSLYHGRNLGFNYTWKSSPPPALPNLAYSKRTQMSSNYYRVNYPYIYASGQAVDGDRQPGAGFVTYLQPHPWWMIDLSRSEQIGSMILYKGLGGPQLNSSPLVIFSSDDPNTWKQVSELLEGDDTLFLHLSEDWVNSEWKKITVIPVTDDPLLRLVFKTPLTARYILIKASGKCRLSFDEVEICPPSHASESTD